MTLLARRSQFHQDRLAMTLNAASMQVGKASMGWPTICSMPGEGRLAAQARAMAQGSLYQQLVQQSTMLAYLDVIAILAVGAACMIPLIFLMKKRTGGGPAAAH